jgi:predicted homoserine dehydrogenase-like protein
MENDEINVGVVGCGSMGRGIVFQVHATPGMRVRWAADLDERTASAVAALVGCAAGTDAKRLLEEQPVDVLVEATNSIGAAAEYCLKAIDCGANVVLMNAEVDLALGPHLHHEASKKGRVITSDAGDQHGVLATLIAEADAMGLEVVQAGNIKGFLNRRATPESIVEEAAKRRLSPTQCCAYTDGTKLHIEMAVLANCMGYLPPEGGMTGPRAEHVREALGLFDFDSYGGIPRVEYILGAEPGGGVYLVVQPKASLPDEQAFYLNYYKLGSGPRYLLYRPYHLCHLETPKAIRAAMSGTPILAPGQRGHLLGGKGNSIIPTCDVYAHAKRDLKAGETLQHAIGSATCYGLVAPKNESGIPISLLEAPTILKRPVEKDAPLEKADLDLPDCTLTTLWQAQEALLKNLEGG